MKYDTNFATDLEGGFKGLRNLLVVLQSVTTAECAEYQ